MSENNPDSSEGEEQFEHHHNSRTSVMQLVRRTRLMTQRTWLKSRYWRRNRKNSNNPIETVRIA